MSCWFRIIESDYETNNQGILNQKKGLKCLRVFSKFASNYERFLAN